MTDQFTPNKCPVCNGSYCHRYYDNPNGEVVCTKLKEVLNILPTMQWRIETIEKDNFELKTRLLTPRDILALIQGMANNPSALNDYSSSLLKKFIDNPSLPLDVAYTIFQEMIEDKYPFLIRSFAEILPSSTPSPRLQYIKEHITDKEEEKLIVLEQFIVYV
jgi:hypothetical protein